MVKELRKVLSDLGLCFPLGVDKDLFKDYFRVINSVWVMSLYQLK